jgi:gamma-glutamylcyclotransferase (GGCT)/AIG2-like uncharacterized protein YtfP
MSQYLFAYGTLQPGRAPKNMAGVAAKLRAVGAGFLQGTLYDLGRYPGAIADPAAAGKINGVVLELPEDRSILSLLDKYEGFDPQSPGSSEFVRELREVELATGGTVTCWFYRYNWKTESRRRIVSGDWRNDDRID